MKKCFNSVIKVTLSFLLISCLFGCSNNTQKEEVIVNNDVQQEQDNDNVPSITEPEIEEETSIDDDSNEQSDVKNDLDLNLQQLNSITMLNYLDAVTAEVEESSNNRLYLEEVWNALYNNINPNAVDETTQQHIIDLRSLISSLKLNQKKLERIQYIFEQGQAQAVRNAIPSPLSILNAIQADNPLKALVAVTGMALNSINSYETTKAQNELQFLQANWEIEDNKTTALENFSNNAFAYLNNIRRDNNLPGEYAVTNDNFKDFAKKKNDSNYPRVIQSLETNVETYKAYYDYWLVLANNYYKNGDYSKCLDAINEYEKLNVNIFRKNNDLAKVLPSVICSAEETLNGDELISTEKKYADLLYNNAAKSDWASRYFATQTYVNLYGKTNDISYLETAYTWTLDIIDSLIDEQINKNNSYLSDINSILLDEDEGTKEEQTEAKKYNKYLKETRKTELSPVYEPLLINCELLFSISEKLNISNKEKEKIDSILHNNGGKLFLADTLDQQFSFSKNPEIQYIVEFDDDEVVVSGNTICEGSQLLVKINGKTYDDYVIKKIDREESEAEKFEITLASESVKDVDFSKCSKVEVYVKPHNEMNDVKIATFSVSSKTILFWDNYKFERID